MAKATLVCPICEHELSKGERLVIGLDNVGSLIVQHYVHSTIPSRGTMPDEDWYRAIKDAPGDDYSDPGRHICGSAGFRHLTLDQKTQGSSTR